VHFRSAPLAEFDARFFFSNGSMTVLDKFKQQLGLLQSLLFFRFIETLPLRLRI
jgi:hypothetical protein